MLVLTALLSFMSYKVGEHLESRNWILTLPWFNKTNRHSLINWMSIEWNSLNNWMNESRHFSVLSFALASHHTSSQSVHSWPQRSSVTQPPAPFRTSSPICLPLIGSLTFLLFLKPTKYTLSSRPSKGLMSHSIDENVAGSVQVCLDKLKFLIIYHEILRIYFC